MYQNIEKSRHRQLERKAREDRRRALALQTGKTEDELKTNETKQAQAREDATEVKEEVPTPEPETKKEEAAPKTKKGAAPKTKGTKEDVFDFEEDDDDLF